MTFDGLWITLFIFVARVVDIAMSTVRMLLLVRGRKFEAAALSFVEIMLFLFALTMVLNNLDNFLNMVAYAAGFACGCLIGSYVEERLAIGYESAQVIPGAVPGEVLAAAIRGAGFGVTSVAGQGRSGPRDVLLVSARRREVRGLLDLVMELDADAFVTVFETRKVRGGVFRRRKGK